MSSKSPKLFLRQSAVVDSIKTWTPGSFLEVGAGTGQMTRMFLSRGFSGICYDLSPASRKFLIDRTKEFDNKIKVLSALPESQDESYDYLLAFEVLEHIDEDIDALKHWSKFVKYGGKIIISVPAHKNKFSKIDELVGHVRRYERDELFELLKNAGYRNIKIINYGYPVTEISRHISKSILKKDNSSETLSVEERNLKSSYSRPSIISRHLARIPESIYVPFKYVQRWFYDYDLGDGLIAIAEKGRDT